MIESIPLMLTGLGLTASIVYYARVLENQNKTRQTQLFLQLYGTVTEENIQKIGELMRWNWKDYDEYIEKYEKDNSLAPIFTAQCQRFNGIGLLAMKKQVDVDLVYQFAYTPIILLWQKFGDVIKTQRRLSNRYSQNEGLEFLYNELIKRSKTDSNR